MPTIGLMERIARAPIMCDGAMKTQLVEQGFNRGLIPDKQMSFSTGYWNVEHPEVVEAVHRAYLDAGCELILTNTFKISSFHVLIWDRAKTLSEAARESVKLVDAGADAIIVEYMADPVELAAAVEASKQVADWPVMATPVYANHTTDGNGDYRTHRSAHANEIAGVSLDEMTRVGIESGADIVGAHCGHSLDVSDYLAIAQQILVSPHRPTQTPVMIQPNGSQKGKTLAESVPLFLDLGIRILGGCCGTTPKDLRVMCEAMREHGRSNDVPYSSE